MRDVRRRQAVTPREFRLARFGALELAARGQQLRTGGEVDRSIDCFGRRVSELVSFSPETSWGHTSSASQERLVRRIDDAVDSEFLRKAGQF